MKQKFTFIALLLQITLTPLFAQTVLTYSTHGMQEGDVLILKKLEGEIKTGRGGENQIWDYSDLQPTEEHVINYNVTAINPANAQKTFACEQDGEMTVFFKTTPTEKLYSGLTSEKAKIDLEPIREMVFPFQYGSEITGEMKGSYTMIETGETEELNGNYSVIGDGWGTLILPNGVTLKNVLRVKYTKDYYQMYSGNLYHMVVNRYLYYSDCSRYPVMQVHEDFVDCSCNCKSTKYSATYNENITPIYKESVVDNGESALELAKFTYEVYPNPTDKNLFVEYATQTTAKIKISLLDLSGRTLKVFVNAKHKDGNYFASTDVEHFAPGGYILKMEVDDEVYTEKIIKKNQ